MKRKLLCLTLVALMVLSIVPVMAFTVFASEGGSSTPVIEGTTGAGTPEDPVLVDEYSELVAAVNADVTNIKVTDNIYATIPSNQLPDDYLLVFDGGKEYNIDLAGFKVSQRNENKYVTAEVPFITVESGSTLNIENGTVTYENETANKENGNPFVCVVGTLNSTNVNYQLNSCGSAISVVELGNAVFNGGEVESYAGFAIRCSGSASLTLSDNVFVRTYTGRGSIPIGVEERSTGALCFAGEGTLNIYQAMFDGGVAVRDKVQEFDIASKSVEIDYISIATNFASYSSISNALASGDTYFWVYNSELGVHYLGTVSEGTVQMCHSNIRVTDYNREFNVNVVGGDAYKIVEGSPDRTQPITTAKYGEKIYVECGTLEVPYEFNRWDSDEALTEEQKYRTYFEFTMPYNDVSFEVVTINGDDRIENASVTIGNIEIGTNNYPEVISDEPDDYEVVRYTWMISNDLGASWERVDETDLIMPDGYYRVDILLNPVGSKFFSTDYNLTVSSSNDRYRYEPSDFEYSTNNYCKISFVYDSIYMVNSETAGFTSDSVFALFGTATINVAEELGDDYEESYDVTFKWYRDAVLMEDITGDTYTFKGTDGDAKFAAIMTAKEKASGTETTYYTPVITCGKEIGVVRVTLEDLIAGMDSRNLIDYDENQTFITIEGGYARGYDLMYYYDTSRLQYTKDYVEANTKYAFLILIYPTSGFRFDDNVKVVLSENITFDEFEWKTRDYIRLYVDVNAIDDYDFQAFYTTDSTENVGQGDYLKLDVEKMKTESADFAAAYSAGKVTYQWYANDKVIEGATSDKYQIGKDDVGKKISVAINADGKYSASSKIEATNLMSLDITVTDLYVGSTLTTENVTEKNGKVEIVSIAVNTGNGNTLQNQSTLMQITVRPANGYSFPVMTNELFTTIKSAIKINGNAIMSIGGASLGAAPTEIQIFYQFTPETHVHNAVKQDGKAAGCTENGWNEYYKCDECLKYFSDSACTVEITDLAAWKDGAGKIPAAHTSIEFTYTTNNDGTHTKKHACCGTVVGNENCSGGNATCTTKKTCQYCNTAYGDFGEHDFTGVTLTEEIPATCVATGTKAYKDCTVCHKHFEADGVTEIADLKLPIDSTNHDMATEWTGVADGHYYACKRVGCEYHDTLVPHTPDRAEATETEPVKCTACQYKITPALGHTTCSSGIKQNGQAVTCTTDGWNDYYKCSGCEKLYEDAACTILISDFAAWKVGNGKITSEGHKYGAWVSNGDGTHTRTCSVDNSHKENGNCSGGTATCTTKKTCQYCNTAYGDFAVHSHGSAWEKDESGHWNECVCGDKANFAGHTPDRANATETDPIKCTVCEYIITPALGHTTCSGGIKQNGQAATCTVNGWNDYYKCSGCNKIYTDAACTNEITDLDAWKAGAGKIAAAHTPNADDGDCTTEITCSVCGETTTAASTHTDTNTDGKCDTCGKNMPTTPGGDEPGTGTEPGDNPGEGNTDDNDGLGTGAIIGIVAGSVVVGGTGIFALIWFVIKKKSFAELLAVFKKG